MLMPLSVIDELSYAPVKIIALIYFVLQETKIGEEHEWKWPVVEVSF